MADVLTLMEALREESGHAVLLAKTSTGWRCRLDSGNSVHFDGKTAIDAVRALAADRKERQEAVAERLKVEAEQVRRHADDAEESALTLGGLLDETEGVPF